MLSVPQSTIDGVGDFSGGVTTQARVVLHGERAVMQVIDGFRIRGKALEPMPGSRKCSASAVGLAAAPAPPFFVRSGGQTWLVVLDADGCVRYVKLTEGDADWTEAYEEFTADLPADSRMVRLGHEVVVPSARGLLRFEPDYVDSPEGRKRTVLLGIKAPGDYGDAPIMVTCYPTNNAILSHCDEDWAMLTPPAGVTRSLDTGTKTEGTGSIKFVFASGASAVGASTLVAATNTNQTAALDLTGKLHLWLHSDTAVAPGSLVVAASDMPMIPVEDCEQPWDACALGGSVTIAQSTDVPTGASGAHSVYIASDSSNWTGSDLPIAAKNLPTPAELCGYDCLRFWLKSDAADDRVRLDLHSVPFLLVDGCESAWDDNATPPGVTRGASSTYKVAGSKSAYAQVSYSSGIQIIGCRDVGGSAGLDLRAYRGFRVWFRTSVSVAGNELEFLLYDGPGCTGNLVGIGGPGATFGTTWRPDLCLFSAQPGFTLACVRSIGLRTTAMWDQSATVWWDDVVAVPQSIIQTNLNGLTTSWTPRTIPLRDENNDPLIGTLAAVSIWSRQPWEACSFRIDEIVALPEFATEVTLPQIYVGENVIEQDLPYAVGRRMQALALRTGEGWSAPAANITMHLDDVRAVSDDPPETQWDGTHKYTFCYTYAGKSRQAGGDWVYVYGLPSPESAETVEVTTDWGVFLSVPIQKDGSGRSILDDCEVDRLLFWARRSDQSRFYYIGQTEFTSAETYVPFSWYGAPGEYSDELNLDQYLEARHTMPSPARYVQFAEGRLWAQNLDNGSRPTAVACSWYGKPWYWPTRLPKTAALEEGFELDGFTVEASEGRGLAYWRGQLFAFYDTEMHVISGMDWTDTRAVFVAAVGLDNRRALAVGHDRMIWPWNGEFYQFVEGQPTIIGSPRVDASKIDYSKPLDAVYWDSCYALYCTYDGQPSLLIYDPRWDAWVVRTLGVGLVGIGTDGGRLWGLTEGGYGVELMANPSDGEFREWADGDYADMRFRLQTRYMQVSEGSDRRFGRLIADIDYEGSAGEQVLLSAQTVGLLNASRSPTAVALSSAKSRHDIPINLQGEAISVAASYEGSAPPARINFLGFERDRGESR